MNKIAFIIRLFQDGNFHGGGEKIFYKLISKLIQENYIIDVYCTKSNVETSPGINKIIQVGVPYNHLKPDVVENFYEKANELIKKEDYDCVISENITPPLDIIFVQGHSVVHRLNKLKNIFESFLYNFRKVKKERIKYEKKWMKQGYRKIFVLSNILKNDIKNNFGIEDEKIEVIYPGIDKQAPPESVDITSNIVTFGLSAPGFKRKGGYVFLKALGILKKQGYNFKAKVIYPKFKNNLWTKFLVKKYNIEQNIEFLSFQKNMDEFYNNIDCLVMPSLEETFGLVALEAMAKGKLSIVSSYCGASEVLTDGTDSFIFNMKNNPSVNLAEKMSFIIKNKSNLSSIIKKGVDTANNYTWDNTCKIFLEKLQKIK